MSQVKVLLYQWLVPLSVVFLAGSSMAQQDDMQREEAQRASCVETVRPAYMFCSNIGNIGLSIGLVGAALYMCLPEDFKNIGCVVTDLPRSIDCFDKSAAGFEMDVPGFVSAEDVIFYTMTRSFFLCLGSRAVGRALLCGALVMDKLDPPPHQD